MPIMSGCFFIPVSKLGPQNLKYTFLFTNCRGQLANHSVVIYQSKWISTSWTLSPIGHNSESIANDSFSGLLTHGTGVYKLFCTEDTHTYISIFVFLYVCACVSWCACFVLYYHICSKYPGIDIIYIQHQWCYEHNSCNLLPRTRYHDHWPMPFSCKWHNSSAKVWQYIHIIFVTNLI